MFSSLVRSGNVIIRSLVSIDGLGNNAFRANSVSAAVIALGE